jgi:hypothetical protein
VGWEIKERKRAITTTAIKKKRMPTSTIAGIPPKSEHTDLFRRVKG